MVIESPITRNEYVPIYRIEVDSMITLEVLSPTQEWALFGLESFGHVSFSSIHFCLETLLEALL